MYIESVRLGSKSLCSDQIPAELIQAGGETLLSEIHKPTNYIWKKEELPYWWKVYYYPQKGVTKLIAIIIVGSDIKGGT
jgi:hypothetical protein